MPWPLRGRAVFISEDLTRAAVKQVADAEKHVRHRHRHESDDADRAANRNPNQCGVKAYETDTADDAVADGEATPDTHDHGDTDHDATNEADGEADDEAENDANKDVQ